MGAMDARRTVTIDMVVAGSAARPLACDGRTGQRGDRLATEALTVGADSDVKVDFDQPASGDVLAVGGVDGRVGAPTEIEIEDEKLTPRPWHGPPLSRCRGCRSRCAGQPNVIAAVLTVNAATRPGRSDQLADAVIR